jgi:hypothetical protein
LSKFAEIKVIYFNDNNNPEEKKKRGYTEVKRA